MKKMPHNLIFRSAHKKLNDSLFNRDPNSKPMYGLDLSRDIQTSVKRTPRKYANLRSTRDRFHYTNKPSDTAALPFYDTGKFTALSNTVLSSPRKLSNLRSKVERFPKHGFMQKYFDKSRLITQNKVYNTDVLMGASISLSV